MHLTHGSSEGTLSYGANRSINIVINRIVCCKNKRKVAGAVKYLVSMN